MDIHLFEQINKIINDNNDEIIDFSKSLVGALSENPPGDEKKISRLIIKKMRDWKLPEPEIWAKKQNRPNLIYTIKGEGGGNTLLINGHLDTKPIGDKSEWDIDPCKPEIISGKLYGRGSTDMKGAVAAMLAAAWAINHNKIQLKGDLIIALTSDEEAGSKYGASVLVEKGIEADAALIGEPSGFDKSLDALCLACRGVSCGKIIVKGTQMHSSLSDNKDCINASIKLAKVITEMAENFKDHINYSNHPLYEKGPTVNPGVTLEGGIFYGVIPGKASFGFDIRVIPGMDFDVLKKELNTFLNKLESRDNKLQTELIFEKPPLGWVPAVEIDREHLLVKACIEATKKIIGSRPKLVGFSATTDARFFSNDLNIPTIPAFGPGFISLAHAPNEYIEVDSIIDAAKIYATSSILYINNIIK